MIICGSYIFDFNVSKDMKKRDITKEVAVGKVTIHSRLTLIVEQVKVITTLNISKHYTP
jgi:hypothetical protein